MPRTKEITNSDDIIDSRDVIARIAELESDKEADILLDGEAEELAALKALAEEGEGLSDWSHGETLISESHFKEYAQTLAEDLGLMQNSGNWPFTCIDWQQAADELQQDYSSLDFDGVTYYARS